MEEGTLREVREFDRFFAVKLGLFTNKVLGTSWSATEGRVIIEIGRAQGVTAARIALLLDLDKGYLSRVLSKLQTAGIIVRKKSAGDGREMCVSLTEKGERECRNLEELSDQQAEELLSRLSEGDAKIIASSMRTIRSLLSDPPEIVDGQTRIDDVRGLFREYLEVEIGQKRGFDISFQSPQAELAALPGKYARPDGRLLLALCDGVPAGCIALRRFDANTCEVKRLYTRPAFRGRHLGRMLLESALAQASRAGYTRAVCDTDASMVEAIAMYEKAGFKRTDPYYNNPLPGAIYLEKTLQL